MFHNRVTIFIPVLLVLLGLFSGEAKGEEGVEPEKSFTNSIGMKFVYIESGSFMKGSGLTPSELESQFGGKAKWYTDERPQHQVILTRSFYIQITEVTQGQWSKIMGINPSIFRSCGETCPVEKVSWYDAREFIKKLNEKEQTDKYRLPTESEWEYACRANNTAAFCFGKDKKELEDYAWHHPNSWDRTHRVGQKKPNAWGIYDMHGNVWEWCEDWYGDYPSQSVTDPKGPSSGSQRVSRGGSWRSVSRFCRSAYRYGVDPAYRRPSGGLRLVRDP